jgi:predicted ATP-grasp superfamily ATP-dependent carboligase
LTGAVPTRSIQAAPDRSRSVATGEGAVIVGGDYRALGVARSLGRKNVPVWVLWEREERIATVSRYVRRSLAIEEGRSLAEQLLSLGRDEDLAGWALIPTGDHAAAAVARAHADLETIFTMTTPPWSVLRWAHDKRLLHELAEKAGLDTPQTFLPRDRDELARLECPFPAILKPAFKEEFNRFTAAKAWRVDDRPSLLSRYEEASHYVPAETILVQEVIPGDGRCQLAYAALCDDGEPLASVVARRTRQFPRDFGRASTFVETVDDPDVADQAERVLRALGATGLFEVEFKRDARTGSLKLLDVNPRAWGWHSLGARAGVDFPYLLWQLLRGERLERTQGKPGVRWRRLSWDLAAAFNDALQGRLDLREHVRARGRPQVSAIFATDDPVPALLEFPLLVYTAVARLVRGEPL